jgi:hypothetical protein
MPGTFPTPLRLYGIVAQPVFDYTAVPHRAWIDVVDRVAQWVAGTESQTDPVANRIVEGIFNEMGLRYDNERGASHYTDYPGGSWSGASFELSRFAERADGSIINCSDAASILSSYANMVGIDLRYHILTHVTDAGFALNWINGIGRGFAASPFTSGRASFRYHAVTGPIDTRIFDATLALDGDGDPSSAPNTLLMVEGLSQMDYLNGLSPEADEIDVAIDEKVRIR